MLGLQSCHERFDNYSLKQLSRGGDTLYSFARQDYLGEYEIIIVDNNSADDNSQVAKVIAASFPCDAVVKEVCKVAYATRNCGVRAASGETLCFADANIESRIQLSFCCFRTI